MRCRARSLMLVTAVVASLVSAVAAAEDKAADTMKLLREKTRADKRLVVATALDQLLGEFVALEVDHVALLSKYLPPQAGGRPPGLPGRPQ